MADVASSMYDWSTTVGSNSPSDATTIGAGLADNFQQIQATVRAWLASKGADIASATTTDLGAVPGHQHDITGTTTITGFGTVAAGIWKIIKFEGVLTLTHHATNLILPGGANITTADGDVAVMVSDGGGAWRCAAYQQKAVGSWTPVPTSSAGTITTVGTVSGRYYRVGSMVVASYSIAITDNGTGSGFVSIAGLPYASNSAHKYIGHGFNASTGTGGVLDKPTSDTTVRHYKYDGGYPVASGETISGTITYFV
jgi:hypothetical protein